MADKAKLLKVAQKHLSKGNVDKAISTFQQLVAIDPRDQRLLLRLAELQARAGRKKEAIESYEKIAAGYIAQDFTPKAIAVYKTILRLDPELISAYEKLAELYKSQGLEAEALTQLENLFNFFEKKGEDARQIEVLKVMVDMDPENLGFQVRLGEMLAKKGMKNEAAEAFAKAGGTLSRRGFHDRASHLFEKIISLNPQNTAVRKELCSHYLECGQFAGAQKEVEAILEKEPQDPRMVLLLGRILLQQEKKGEGEKRISEAIQLFQDAGELDSVMKEFLFVAQSHLNNGELDEAEIFYRRIWESAPTEERTVRGLVKVAERRNDRTARIENLGILARILRDKGDEKGARKVYEELYQLDLLNQEAKDFIEEYDRKTREAETGGPLFTEKGPEEEEEEAGKIQIDGAELLPPELMEEEETAGPAQPEDGEVQIEELGDLEEFSIEDEALAEVEPEEEVLTGEEAEAAGEDQVPDIVLEGFSGEEERLPQEDFGREEAVSEDGVIHVEMTDEDEMSAEDLLAESEIYKKYGLEDQVAANLEKLRSLAPDDPSILERIRILEEKGERVDEAGEAVPSLGEPEPPTREIPGAEEAREVKEAPEAATGAPDQEALPAPPPVMVAPPEGEQITEGADPFKEELEEADFYLLQGLKEEAVRIYRSILSRSPGHSAAESALADLDQGIPPLTEAPPADREQEASAPTETVFPDVSQEVPPPKGPPVPGDVGKPTEKSPERGPTGELRSKLVVEDATSEDAEGFLDLADELRMELSNEFEIPGEPAKETAAITFEEVFAQFKKGIEEVLGDEEYETHYNLGIAYKDMGLFDDALREFEVASRESSLAQDSLSLMAVCFLEKKDFDSAVKVVQKALEAAPESSRPGLLYQLGEAYEKKKEYSKALAAYEEVQARDPRFEGIEDLIEKARAMVEQDVPVDPDLEEAAEAGPGEGGMDEMLTDLIREVEEMAKESSGEEKERPKDDPGKDRKDRISYL